MNKMSIVLIVSLCATNIATGITKVFSRTDLEAYKARLLLFMLEECREQKSKDEKSKDDQSEEPHVLCVVTQAMINQMSKLLNHNQLRVEDSLIVLLNELEDHMAQLKEVARNTEITLEVEDASDKKERELSAKFHSLIRLIETGGIGYKEAKETFDKYIEEYEGLMSE